MAFDEPISVFVGGSTLPYTLRSLRDDESDILRWVRFCAYCFEDKPDPPTAEYFKRHFYNDPWRDAAAVHIIEFVGDELEEDGNPKREIVSSMRVFRRTISDGGGGTIEAGGIGEVCTHPDHRRRGLSKILLDKSISYMEKCGIETSLLHAGFEITPVYKKNGNYECTTSKWSVVKIDKSKLLESGPLSVRLANFPSDTEQLASLHKAYSEGRFAGCIVRTLDYWNNYISKEIGQSLFVICNESIIVAWLSIRPRGDRFQLREFGLRMGSVSAFTAISQLLRYALEKENTHEAISLLLPTVVLSEVKEGQEIGSSAPEFICWEAGVQVEDDIGWMYRTIVRKDDRPSMVELTKDEGQLHLIWPADSF